VLRPAPLPVGSLSGNAFRVVLRSPDAQGCAKTVAAVLTARIDKLSTLGGFPNYFGPQRFSRVSLLSRHPGVHIIAGRWSDAFDCLLDGTAASAILKDTGDPQAAAASFSGLAHRDAAIVVEAMRRVQTSLPASSRFLDTSAPEWQKWCREALQRTPFALRQLWLHAAQSLVFNMLLSLCMTADSGPAPVPAQLPLLGAATIGPAMEALPSLLPAVLQELGLSADHFAQRCVCGVPLRGGWRGTTAAPHGVTVAADGDSALVLSFELPPSAYATMLLRDILGYVPLE
jgi:tRNA pseudouridine13 synthase